MPRQSLKGEIELREFLSFVGLQLIEMTGKFPYENRKGRVFAAFDGERILCSYATFAQIKSWARSKLVK